MEFALIPLDKGASFSADVAETLKIVDESGLDYLLTPMGTIVEGRLDDVLTLLRACVRTLERDCTRLTMSVKMDVRRGSARRMDHKVRIVEALVAGKRRPRRR